MDPGPGTQVEAGVVKCITIADVSQHIGACKSILTATHRSSWLVIVAKKKSPQFWQTTLGLSKHEPVNQ